MAHAYRMRLNYIATSVAVMLLWLGALALAAEPEQAGPQAADSGQTAGTEKGPTAATTGKGFDEKAFGKAILNLGKPQGNERPAARREMGGDHPECWCDKPYKTCTAELVKDINEFIEIIISRRNKLQTVVNKTTKVDNKQLARLYLIEQLTTIYTNSRRALDLIAWRQSIRRHSGDQIHDDLLKRLLDVDGLYSGINYSLDKARTKFDELQFYDLGKICSEIYQLTEVCSTKLFCYALKIE